MTICVGNSRLSAAVAASDLIICSPHVLASLQCNHDQNFVCKDHLLWQKTPHKVAPLDRGENISTNARHRPGIPQGELVLRCQNEPTYNISTSARDNNKF